MPFVEPCQFFNVLAEHPRRRRLEYDVRRNLGVRTHLRRLFGKGKDGAPSQYAEGTWVQVLDKESLQRTLDTESRTRGLLFLTYQWAYCGGVFRVKKVMRRMLDDAGVLRAISRTILLDGPVCSPTEGCGRSCPLMFRDEWVKLASAPVSAPQAESSGAYARVRSIQEIRASLDRQGKRDGLLFMPEMAQWAGQRFRVARQLKSVFEYDRYVAPPHPIFILEGLTCSGAILGAKGACDRGCSILWHADWLDQDHASAG